MRTLNIPAEISEAMKAAASLVLSVSGGKDSDAMTWAVLAWAKGQGYADRIRLVHADLGRAELKATPEHILAVAELAKLPLSIVKHSKFDLLDGIWNRHKTRPGVPPWPSSKNRQCTSDWKRDPTDKWLRNTFKSGIVIVAMGLRAEESLTRAKKPATSPRERASSKERTAIDWLPIHDWKESDVWEELEGRPRHEAYARGNRRVSCALCILANNGDLLNGATQDPELFQAYCDVEIKTGFSFKSNFWLGHIAPELLRADQIEFYQSKKTTPKKAA